MSKLNREQLMAKYPSIASAAVLDPLASTQVRAVLRAEELMARVFPNGDQGVVLFDPALVPELAAKADEAAAALYRGLRHGWVRHDTMDDDYDDSSPAEQGVTRVHIVGSDTVHIIRDRWREHPNRLGKPVDFHAGLMSHLRAMSDGHQCDCLDWCERGCNIQIAKRCSGPTRMLARAPRHPDPGFPLLRRLLHTGRRHFQQRPTDTHRRGAGRPATRRANIAEPEPRREPRRLGVAQDAEATGQQVTPSRSAAVLGGPTTRLVILVVPLAYIHRCEVVTHR